MRQSSRGSLADRVEIHKSAVFSKAFVYLCQFLVRNQEHGENCKELTAAGVKTPWRVARFSLPPDITCVPDCLVCLLDKAADDGPK
jgi:hypothetical protein